MIDCHASGSNECVGTLTIRPAQAGTINQTFSLVPVIARPDVTPVDVGGALLVCDTCTSGVITIPAKPSVIARFTIQLPHDWRDPWLPQVGEGVIGLVPANNTVFDGAPKRLRVLAPAPSPWQTSVLMVSGLLALLVAITLVVRLRSNDVQLGDRLGAPAWNSAESWAANLTVGAGLVSGVIGLAAIDAFTVFMTKPAYSVVNVLCGSLLLLAPLLYGLSRRRNASGAMEGVVGAVLVAGSLVLWAGTGQLLTFSLLIVEVWRASALDGAVAATVVVLSVLLIAGLLVHGHVALFAAAMAAKPIVKPGAPAQEGRADRVTKMSATKVAPRWTLP